MQQEHWTWTTAKVLYIEKRTLNVHVEDLERTESITTAKFERIYPHELGRSTQLTHEPLVKELLDAGHVVLRTFY